MEKFVDCLVRLPNLRALDILSASTPGPISKALKRKHVILPSIRQLRIVQACHYFIRKCPNLEDLTFVTGLDTDASSTVCSYGRGLERIAGVNIHSSKSLTGELVSGSSSLDIL